MSSGRSKANRKKLQNEEFREAFHRWTVDGGQWTILENGQIPREQPTCAKSGAGPWRSLSFGDSSEAMLAWRNPPHPAGAVHGVMGIGRRRYCPNAARCASVEKPSRGSKYPIELGGCAYCGTVSRSSFDQDCSAFTLHNWYCTSKGMHLAMDTIQSHPQRERGVRGFSIQIVKVR